MELACQSVLTVLINFGFLVFGVTDYSSATLTSHYGAVTARNRGATKRKPSATSSKTPRQSTATYTTTAAINTPEPNSPSACRPSDPEKGDHAHPTRPTRPTCPTLSHLSSRWMLNHLPARVSIEACQSSPHGKLYPNSNGSHRDQVPARAAACPLIRSRKRASRSSSSKPGRKYDPVAETPMFEDECPGAFAWPSDPGQAVRFSTPPSAAAGPFPASLTSFKAPAARNTLDEASECRIWRPPPEMHVVAAAHARRTHQPLGPHRPPHGPLRFQAKIARRPRHRLAHGLQGHGAVV